MAATNTDATKGILMIYKSIEAQMLSITLTRLYLHMEKLGAGEEARRILHEELDGPRK